MSALFSVVILKQDLQRNIKRFANATANNSSWQRK